MILDNQNCCIFFSKKKFTFYEGVGGGVTFTFNVERSLISEIALKKTNQTGRIIVSFYLLPERGGVFF